MEPPKLDKETAASLTVVKCGGHWVEFNSAQVPTLGAHATPRGRPSPRPMHARLLVADTSAIGQVRPPHVDQGLQTVVTKDSADPVGPMDGEDVLKNDYCSSVLVTSKARGPVRFVLAPFVAMPFAPNVAFLLLYSLFYFFFFFSSLVRACLIRVWNLHGQGRAGRTAHYIADSSKCGGLSHTAYSLRATSPRQTGKPIETS